MNVTFGKIDRDTRPFYTILVDGNPAGEIRRTKRGVLDWGGWGWTVACRFAPLATFDTVAAAKAYARKGGR